MGEENVRKDVWEKIKILTTFFSSVLLGVVGIVFTYVYNQRQLDQNRNSANAQVRMQELQLQANVEQEHARLALQHAQLQTAQLQAMTQLMPYLVSKDPQTRQVAAALLRSIDSASGREEGGSDSKGIGMIDIIPNPGQVHPQPKPVSPFGAFADLLRGLDLAKQKVLNPAETFPAKLQAFKYIDSVNFAVHVDPVVRDSAKKAINEIQQSPNTPLLGYSFTPDEFRAYVDTLRLRSWRPQFVVVHHTAMPSLAQSPNGFTAARILSLIKYFSQSLGWQGAPHLFIDDRKIWVMNPLTSPGIHTPGWNNVSIGIEMLGNYDEETLNSGRGAQVLANMAGAIATLNRKFNISADSLKLHRDAPGIRAGTKSCPGTNVDRSMIISAVGRAGASQ